MKKFVLSALLILGFAGYALFQRFGNDNEARVIAPAGLTQTDTTGEPASSGAALTTPAPITAAPPVSNTFPSPKASLYKDGQYTGPSTDAYYGLVQVRATIAAGKITAVDFLQYPNDRRTSEEINGQAMPYLKAEAIRAQSANVDVVSGATQTSEAFIKSLGSALSQAKS